jgi:putative endopeptidase
MRSAKRAGLTAACIVVNSTSVPAAAWALILALQHETPAGSGAAFAAQGPAAAQAGDVAAAAAAETAAAGVDLAVLDTSTSPCEDFYQFACGDWLADAPILPTPGGASRLGDTSVRVRTQVRDLLTAAARNEPARSAAARKVGDFYASCMDQAAIEARGLSPLQPDLDRIAALGDKSGLAALAARLHQVGAGVLFNFGTQANATSGGLLTGVLGPGGMGLPDPSLYFGNDRDALQVRGRYLAHVTRMLELLGDAPAAAQGGASSVVQIETRLARAVLTGLSRNQSPRPYHKLTRQQLAALAPRFNWDAYFAGFGAMGATGATGARGATLGATAMPRLVVSDPDFFKELDALLGSTSLEHWRSYLRWHLAQASAEMLPRAFGAESEAFFGRIQGAARQTPPRSQVCATLTSVQLGEELGHAYVEKAFSAEARSRALRLAQAIDKALASDLSALPWLSEGTKQQALAKLGALRLKVGYPEHWHADAKLQIVRGDALGNWQRSHAFALERGLAKIGKPPDRNEWQLAPLAVNAAYIPLDNEVELPAGMLQPPIFEPHGDSAANFGAAGVFIGQELSRGFDDEGSQYDAEGKLRSGWTAGESREYERRAACFVEQASELEVGGERSEDVAWAAGVRVAYDAYVAGLAGGMRQKLEGFTPEQRFFLAFAQSQCSREPERPDETPARFLVDSPLSNMPEFQQAFSCKAGTPMVHAPICRVF